MDEADLREHVVGPPHDMKPDAAANYQLTALRDWHARDHSVAAIQTHHTHQED